MSTSDTLFESTVAGLDRIYRGKVRDIYSVDDDHLLIVTTDRLSAYDVVMPDPVPGKGQVLTRISNFWFKMMEDLIPNHLTDRKLNSIIDDNESRQSLEQRAIVTRRLRPLPIEAVVRGYLIGSGWRDYQRTGQVCGIDLPPGLEQAGKLPQTLFTPATKADAGDHDENISFEALQQMIGDDLAEQVRAVSIQIYERAAEYALGRGIIIADTKFEFGQDDQGRLYIIDEILTPDSSRFWPLSDYRTGISPPSFDKQFVRDYLETLDWDKTAPGPRLPPEIIQQTGDKYREVLHILTA
ncbi:MAG: phosphoribosylaminoimidazolesuccinocarboxamide synthase [Gammaproteobacteria bacterium]|nr:MAG: phosphoribosylaminoimidazolesuccinocarboxamide synthase [Gammaproteobacteria bacterium]